MGRKRHGRAIWLAAGPGTGYSVGMDNRHTKGCAVRVRNLLLASAMLVAPALGAAYPQRVGTLAQLQGYPLVTMQTVKSFLLDETTAGASSGSKVYLFQVTVSATPDGIGIIAPSDHAGTCASGCLLAQPLTGSAGYYSSYNTRAALSTLSKAQAIVGPYNHLCISEDGYAGCYDAIAGSTATIDGVTVLTFSDAPATGRWVRSGFPASSLTIAQTTGSVSLYTGDWSTYHAAGYSITTLNYSSAMVSLSGGVWLPVASCTPDAYFGLCVRDKSGTGTYWWRSRPQVLSTTMFGSDPTGGADSAASFNAAYVAANFTGLNIVDPPGTFKLSSTVTPGRNVSYTGSGEKLTVLDFSTNSSSTPCMRLQLPNGSDYVIGPSFKGFTLSCVGTYGVQLNSIAGGFTDTPATQDYMADVHFEKVYVSGGTTAAIQISKCFHCTFDDVWIDTSLQTTGDIIDVEGSDFARITGGRLFVNNGSAIKFVQQNTFGNDNVAKGPLDIGCFNSAHPCVVLSTISDTLRDATLEGNSAGYLIELPGGLHHGIYNNNMSDNASGSHWLHMSTRYVSVDAQNNYSGSTVGGVVCDGTCGLLWFDNATPSRIVHNANPNYDSGFPFNSNPSDRDYRGYLWVVSAANVDGVGAGECGTTLNAINNELSVGSCSTPGYATFYSSHSGSAVVGSLTTDVEAWCNGGTGTLGVRLDDGSHATTAATATLSLTAYPKMFKNVFATPTSISTEALLLLLVGTCGSPRVRYVGLY